MSIGQMRRRVARGMAVLSVLAVTVIAVVTVAPQAASASTNNCGYGSSNGNVQTCVSVGDTSVGVSAQVKDSGRVLNVCLHRNGVRIGCTGYSYVPRGSGSGFSWVPGGQVSNGTYCAVTWKEDPNGSTTELASECVGVTSVG